MNAARLAVAGLRHYWRTNLGVALGAGVAAAVLVGALLVGDSVRATLEEQALARIGKIDAALDAGDRLFGDELAGALSEDLDGVRSAAVLRLFGVASVPGAGLRANDVQTLGVDGVFASLAQEPSTTALPAPGDVVLNRRLSNQLRVGVGDHVLLRIDRPSAMSRDMVLAQSDERTIALRVRVSGVLGDSELGRFSLTAGQLAPFSAFLARGWLQEQLEIGSRSNLLLVGGEESSAAVTAAAEGALRRVWTLADAGLDLRSLALGEGVELTGRRVFLDAAVGEAAAKLPLAAAGVLTTFAKELRVGERSTPYSFVSALGPLGDGAGVGEILPADLADDELVINSWLAADLEAEVGDELLLTTYALGPSSRLVERMNAFRVRGVVPLAGDAADPSLMPAFPGLAGADHCRDWEPGVDLDLARVRDEDEAYWDEYGGTPKAFVSLAAGQEMWEDRFGSLTAVRFPGAERERVASLLREALDPASVGLFFRDVRTPALASSASATDFGSLFGGLSFFLIAAALLLMAMLFAFGVEQRARELGLLLAIGFRRRRALRGFLGEGVVLAVAGSAIGTAGGVAFTAAMLRGLGTIWSGAVGGTAIELAVSPISLTVGFLISVVTASGSMWLMSRRLARRPASELMAGASTGGAPVVAGRARRAPWLAALCVLGATAVLATNDPRAGSAAAGAFFGAGALLLAAALAASGALLAWLGGGRRPAQAALAMLAMSGAARRPGRSLATVALLASGTFLVVAVGANRLDAGRGSAQVSGRDTGTGGFALFGRSTLGVLHDINSAQGREAYGLDPELLDGVQAVPLRVRDGDEASCLNLSLSTNPRLVGVEPALLDARRAFRFAQTVEGVEAERGWLALETVAPDGAVPAIGDQASITWAMHKQVGDTILYTDERGRPFRVRIVGAVASSILQGNLLIAESAFERLFPSQSGHRMFLIDAPFERAPAVAGELGRALEDVGLEVTSAAARLDEFNAVQNTYLSIFGVLGAIGMLLGSVGLGLVVLRNTLERRGELALLRAVGFRRAVVGRLVIGEHALLLALGLGAGSVAGLVAMLPAVAGAGAGWERAAGLVAALAASGILWVAAAARWAVGGDVLDALRKE
ncbi:MAG TPA: ABC transporter permease [Planctomycetota bacterium]|jgi:ABC-type lipoprotein release transport system permease subunit|nr:ABC transporter permease [Planctomycetota bacterium]